MVAETVRSQPSRLRGDCALTVVIIVVFVKPVSSRVLPYKVSICMEWMRMIRKD